MGIISTQSKKQASSIDSNMETLTTSKCLWNDGKSMSYKSLHSPFVQAMAKGTLSEWSFKGYIRQCYPYLVAYAEVHRAALRLAETWEDADERNFLVPSLQLLLKGVDSEVLLLENMCKSHNVDITDTETVNEATVKYCSFLEEAGTFRSLAHIMAAVVPCCRLYDWLAIQLAAAYPEATSPSNPYNYWIVGCLTPEYGFVPTLMEKILDTTLGKGDLEEARRLYLGALANEAAFFNANIGPEPIGSGSGAK